MEGQHGTANLAPKEGPKESSQSEANGRQCAIIDGSNCWNAAILSGWAYSTVKLVVEKSTPRSKNGTTTKAKYAKGQGKPDDKIKGRPYLGRKEER